jgi:hypothetical protein
MNVCIFITNTFFTGSEALNTRVFFITGFLICHSFLDFQYIGFSRHIGVIVYPA